MVTYGDLMGLLLTFFILMLSVSTMSEPKKFNEAMGSIQQALGIFKGRDDILPLSTPQEQDAVARLRRMARDLQRRMQLLNLEKEIEIKLNEEKGMLQILLPNSVLYDSGSATLKAEAGPILSDVAEVLHGAPGAIFQVKGHTDSIPLNPGPGRPWRDNYDLSYARAKAVSSYLNREGRVPQHQFEIVARGPNEPVATNDTPEGRAANRRVEILVHGDLDAATIESLQEQINGLNAVEVEAPEGARAL